MPDKQPDPQSRRFRILKAEALNHWEEHRPKELARLQRQGKADKHLDSLVSAAIQETDSLRRSPHLNPDQIREIVLPQYIYLPEE